MTEKRWNFEDAAAQMWTVFTVCAVTTLTGLALFAAFVLN